MTEEKKTSQREERRAKIRRFVYDNSELLSDHDKALVELAESAIRMRYLHGWHQLYAVGTDEQGNLCRGLHLDQPSGRASICAEAAAIHEAAQEQRIVTTIVTVRHQRPDEGSDVHVVTPCGDCRERLMHHNPDLYVIVWIGGEHKELRKVPIEFLLALPFKQRKKPNGNHELSTHVFDRLI